jgi:superfamily II DNA or RNA helicase
VSAVRVRVGSRVLVYKDDLPGILRQELQRLFEHENPKHKQLRALGIRFSHKAEPRIIKTWNDGGEWLSFPRGGMQRVRDVLLRGGLVLRAKDERTEGYAPIAEKFTWPEYRRALFQDQEEALTAMLARETCYLRSPTGSGKTSTCLAGIVRVRVPTIVIVWTGALFDQWVDRITDPKELGVARRDIGIVRGSRKSVGPITVAMQQTLAHFRSDDPFWRFFGMVIADELQRFSAPTFIASLDPFVARYRWGVSADERRADKKEFLAHDLFGDLALSIDRRDLVAKGRVRDVEIRVVPTGWESEVDLTLGTAGDRYRMMLDAMAVSDERDEHVLAIIEAERARGEQILVFSLRVDHCRRLQGKLQSAGISAGLMLGGVENKAALDDAVEGMRAGTMRVAVGTVQAVGTGVDLPSVGVGIATMPIASNRQLLGQVAGRVCRVAGGEGAARLYYLADEARRKDWTALFDDGRPVFVRKPDGSWLDARKEKRKARAIAFPEAASFGGYGGDDQWRRRSR